MTLRNNYWSDSAFANWIRGTNKLSSGSSQAWRNWENQSKQLHPARHWIAEELLDTLQDIIFWPTDQLYELKCYINNRWITKTHLLQSQLKPGDWHELDTRIIHCLFNELVLFVELEQAWHYIVFDQDAQKKYRPRSWARGRFRWRTWRCAPAGVDYLIWASNLVYDDKYHQDQPHYMQPTPQALAAHEQLALYTWWTVTRPARPDPYDASGWSSYCDRKRSQGLDFLDTVEDRKDLVQSRTILDRLNEMEQAYDREDEEMMIRLIKIRHHLWT